MKANNGKIDIVFIIILVVIVVILLFVLAPQNIRINDPRFMVQYWNNISYAVSNIGRSLSYAMQSLGQSISGLFGNFSLR